MKTLLNGLSAFRNYLASTTQDAKEKAVALILDAAIEYVTSKEAVANPVATAPTDSPAPTAL
jgi:hypothetical protein